VATALLASGTSAPPTAEPFPDLVSLAVGERRAAWLPARPEAGGEASVDPVTGPRRPAGPRIDEQGHVTGIVGWVPDAPGADALVGTATDPAGRRCTVVVAAPAAAVVEEVASYDASRRLAHVRLSQVPATCLTAPGDAPESSWALAQALLGAEALGAAEWLLELSVEHARRRLAFGRAIGSFQAVKHQLVEVLRRIDNARALSGRAAAALATGQADAYTVACALRFCGGDALDCASRTALSVHGGMGSTWEHPAALYFRRAQVTRRLLAGQAAAAAEVGRRLLTAA
jgi:alkylation response protein AidB-like acyl-CoA dehydrogenase